MIDGLNITTVSPIVDNRGSFQEIFSMSCPQKFFSIGIQQVSISHSQKYVVRGLHFQIDPPMAKMIRIVKGAAYVFAVDINPLSSTFKETFANDFYDSCNTLISFPPWCAIGYFALEDTIVQYYHSRIYNQKGAFEINIFDPDLKLLEKDPKMILSEKDRKAPLFKDWLKYQISHNLSWTPEQIPFLGTLEKMEWPHEASDWIVEPWEDE